MGQAWCKEKTSKAQDSKSPLDRVFVRCAHRIYPGLKEEGSVLGGATQRVTSSEIGYAGSPPRDVLARGRSIDSVDRPFHPSDWVDVNLEVPSTPRACSVLTNLTVDTGLHPATTPTSSCSNLKDVTPVPPPRRRKRNRGRPLPPKPDEMPENSNSNAKRADASEEPLYSSVKSPKTSGDEQDREEDSRAEKSCSAREDSKHDGRRTKEIYEHKVNGTGKIIPSDVVSGKRTTSSSDERKNWKISDTSHQCRKIPENEEYERFSRNQSVKDSSTPSRQQGRRKSKELEKQIKDSSGEPTETSTTNARPKNYSTVSLPNYDELDVARYSTKRTKDGGGAEGKTKSRRPVRSSTGSLPVESILSPFSQKTSVRLEDYIPRRGSTDNLAPYQVLGKLNRSENGDGDGEFVKYDPSKLEDWDLSDISNCELNHLRRLSFESPSASPIKDQKQICKGEDVVDFSQDAETGKDESKTARRVVQQNITESSFVLEKPEGFGKSPSPVLKREDGSRSPMGPDYLVDPNGSHLRYFAPPTLAENCKVSGVCDAAGSPASREPFFLDEEKHRSMLDTIGGSCGNGAIAVESDRSEQSRMIFGRSLSNESEPYDDAYESKELRGHPSVTSNLIRTISEESLPREMLEEVDRDTDDFFDEKLAKDVHNKLKKDCVEHRVTVKTPPPSPEPRIRAEILDNDHSTLLKVLKEEAAEESNLSSMTPSLTELEAALSDMLEKEDPQDEVPKELEKVGPVQSAGQSFGDTEKLIEPEIVPVEKNPGSCNDHAENAAEVELTIETSGAAGARSLLDEDFEERTDEVPVSLGRIFDDRKPPVKGRKVSFCAWEETRMTEVDLSEDRRFIDPAEDLDENTALYPIDGCTTGHSTTEEAEISRFSSSPEDAIANELKIVANIGDFPPEKPSRLHRNLEDLAENIESIPTPPRRKNKGSLGGARKEIETAQNGSAMADPYPNDRLI